MPAEIVLGMLLISFSVITLFNIVKSLVEKPHQTWIENKDKKWQVHFGNKNTSFVVLETEDLQKAVKCESDLINFFKNLNK